MGWNPDRRGETGGMMPQQQSTTQAAWVQALMAANNPEPVVKRPRVGLRGEASPNAKLTEDDVIAARRAHKRAKEAVERINATYSIDALAERYGVSYRAMQMALSGETWGHV